MYERFTDAARKVMQNANTTALECGHRYIGTEHILMGLSQIVLSHRGEINEVFSRLELDPERVIQAVRAEIGSEPEIGIFGKLPQTPLAKRVIALAMEQARSFNHNYVGTEHMLLGLIAEGSGIASRELAKLGVTLELARVVVLDVLSGDHALSSRSADPPDGNLTAFCRKLASKGGFRFDPVKFIARVEEDPELRLSLLSVLRAAEPAA